MVHHTYIPSGPLVDEYNAMLKRLHREAAPEPEEVWQLMEELREEGHWQYADKLYERARHLFP